MTVALSYMTVGCQGFRIVYINDDLQSDLSCGLIGATAISDSRVLSRL